LQGKGTQRRISSLTDASNHCTGQWAVAYQKGHGSGRQPLSRHQTKPFSRQAEADRLRAMESLLICSNGREKKFTGPYHDDTIPFGIPQHRNTSQPFLFL